MKITVCEFENDAEKMPGAWDALVAHSRRESSDIVLLPELPFYPWPPKKEVFNADTWQDSVLAHDKWIPKLGELAPAAVAGSRSVLRDGKRLNEGFVWTADGGYRGIHSKYYIPNEEGFWEATWYDRGDGSFEPAEVRGTKMGFLICSELWSMLHARGYGKAGVHLLLTPRAGGKSSVDKWLAGGRTSAVVSGCFSASSNRVGGRSAGGFGGQGWIVDPDGRILATTSADLPQATVDIDLNDAILAKKTYPRNCLD